MYTHTRARARVHTCIYVIVYFSKNISTNQSVLKIYMKSATFMEMDTIPIADELYLLGKRSFLTSKHQLKVT